MDSTPELNSDNDDETLNLFTNTPGPPTGDPLFRRHHVASLNADVIIRQLPSEGLSFQLWPAATTLFNLLSTDHLDHHLRRRSDHRLRILELGSGTGLVGIAAAAILGAEVTVTDLGRVIPNLDYNVEANEGVIRSGGGTVVAKELSWGSVEQMKGIGREYDVILGSDVVYHDHLYEPLLDTLKHFLLGEGGGVFLMAHLKRWKKEGVFFKKARKLFHVDVVHRDCPSEGKRVGVIVYRFVGKQVERSSRSDLPKQSLAVAGKQVEPDLLKQSLADGV